MATSSRKDCVRSLLAMSLILAVTFSMLLIWFPVPIKFSLTNQTNQNILIKQHESSRWGEIPGELEYNFTRNLDVRSHQHMNAFTMNFDIKRMFTNIGYEHIQSVINYNEVYDQSVQSAEDKVKL